MDERVLLVQCVWRGYLGRREAARAQLVKERNSIKSRKKKGHAEKNEQFDDVAVFKAKKKTHRIQVNQLLSPSRVSSRLQESPEKGTPQLIEPIICDSHLQVIHEDSREFMRDSLNNTADPFVNTPAIAVINTECDEGEQEADSLDGDGEQGTKLWPYSTRLAQPHSLYYRRRFRGFARWRRVAMSGTMSTAVAARVVVSFGLAPRLFAMLIIFFFRLPLLLR